MRTFALILVVIMFALAGAGAWYWHSPQRLKRDLGEMCLIAQGLEAQYQHEEIGAPEMAAAIAREIDKPLRDRRIRQIHDEIAQNFGKPGMDMPELLKLQSEIVAREGVPDWSCPVLFGL